MNREIIIAEQKRLAKNGIHFTEAEVVEFLEYNEIADEITSGYSYGAYGTVKSM
jgi:hypothetical protein